MAGAGRRSLSPRSASFKLQVDRHWWGRRPEDGQKTSPQHSISPLLLHLIALGQAESKASAGIKEHFLLPEMLPGSSEGVTVASASSRCGEFTLEGFQNIIAWSYVTYKKSHGTGRQLCAAFLPAPLQGFRSVWVSVWLVLGLPGCVLLSWRLVRYLAGGRMEVPTGQQMVWEHWGSQSSSAFQLPCQAAGHFGFAVLGSSLFQKETCSQT